MIAAQEAGNETEAREAALGLIQNGVVDLPGLMSFATGSDSSLMAETLKHKLVDAGRRDPRVVPVIEAFAQLAQGMNFRRATADAVRTLAALGPLPPERPSLWERACSWLFKKLW